MSTTHPATQYFDAVSTAYDAMIEAFRTTGKNNVRLSQRLLDETRKAQSRTLGVVRRVVENPTDLPGNMTAVIAATAEAQDQVMELSRSLFHSVPEANEQARTRFEQLARANQDVVRTAVDAAREMTTANPWLPAFRATPTA